MRQRRFGIGKVSGLKEKHQVWQGIKNFLFVTPWWCRRPRIMGLLFL